MHKQCKNNAKPIPKKMHRKRENKSPKDALECKKKRKKMRKKTHVSTKPMQQMQKKMHKKGTQNAKTMHKKCKKNAIKKQNECDQKRSGLCLCIFFALYLRFFGDFFLHFLCVSLRKRKKNRKSANRLSGVLWGS